MYITLYNEIINQIGLKI